MSKPERSAQQREPLDPGGLVASLREWADKIEGDPSGIVVCGWPPFCKGC